MDNSLLEKIEEQYASMLPFVAYRKHKSDVLTAVLQEDDTLHTVDSFNESGFVMAPFNTEEESVLIPFNEVIEEIYSVEKFVVPAKQEEFLENKLEHKKLVETGVKAIEIGKFDKVVLSRCEQVNNITNSPIELFQKLLNSYTNAFVYLWYHPRVGCWLGATPEVLLSTHAKRYKTMALAGTQLYSKELIWQEKEQKEQQFVTDFIIKELNEVTNKMQVGKPYTVKAGDLAHIRTDITGTYKVGLKEVINKLHPTPAVCGLPKDTAKQFILKNENYQRAFYTGFLGELNKPISRRNNRRNTENKAYQFSTTASDLFVNLRCMQYKNDNVIIYVGGGITKDSIPEKEFQETVNKATTMKRVLTNL